MKLNKLIDGIKNGSVTLLENGHTCRPLLDRLEFRLERVNTRIDDYKQKIRKGVTMIDTVSCKNMLEFYKMGLEVEVGSYIDNVENQCSSCGESLYPILIDEKTLGYIPSGEYWDIAEASGKTYGYVAKKEDFKPCSCIEMNEKQKFVAEIDVPSGKLVFQNFFKTKELYESINDGYNSINSLAGRNDLMQELASRNVGYGQMGNMGITVYSNDVDEIIIGDSLDVFEENVGYYEECPEEIGDGWAQQLIEGNVFKNRLEAGNFDNKGDISLSVWRWQCADIETLKKWGEEPTTDKYQDVIILDVKPGRYEINHFYDFPSNGDYLYSTIKLIK